MEKEVNELIIKIMNSKNLNPRDLNDIIKLHKNISNKKFEYQMNKETKSLDQLCVLEKQIKRLEILLKDKLKQIHIFLSDECLDYLVDIIFYRDGNADIKDIRLINKYEIAIIRENSIQLGDLSHNVNRLSAGSSLQEEAYLEEECKTGKEPVYCDPRETFSCFYEEMDNNINQLKKDLKVNDNGVEMYFDRDLDSFFFESLKTFKVIITRLPNTIEIYKVDATQDKWIPKRINGEPTRDYMEKIDFSLLKEDILITNLKQRYNDTTIDGELTDLDIEMALDKFKQTSFGLENLINTYNSLFNNNNCMLEENENAINRLKYITVEKLMENGFEYEKAFIYTEKIFETIQLYKKQIMSAINGKTKFPEDSLVGAVKKIEYSTKVNK